MNEYGPTLKVKLSDEQMDGLKALARTLRTSTSDIVRNLIKMAIEGEGIDHGKAVTK